MLILNFSHLYIRCGVLMEKSDSFEKEIKNYEGKFKYINPEIKIEYNSNYLILFQINYFKVDDFIESPDFE